jgi:hypothetical protein
VFPGQARHGASQHRHPAQRFDSVLTRRCIKADASRQAFPPIAKNDHTNHNISLD